MNPGGVHDLFAAWLFAVFGVHCLSVVAERIFNALAQGGQVQMPFTATFWAKGFGMALDRFGTPWMVNAENMAG